MWNRNVRSGQKPFSSFFIRLSAGDSYFRVVKSLVEGYPRFPSVIPSWISLQEIIWFALAAGKEDCILDSPWSYADARLCRELKLVWFEDFKIPFWLLCSDIPGVCLASVYPIYRWSDVGNGGRVDNVSFRYFDLFFVNLRSVRLYVSVLLRAVDVNSWRQ